MAEAKAQRLSKVAKDLGVGLGSIVEFLNSKKISVEENPNTKIEPDVLEILMDHFASDHKTREAVVAKTVKTRELRETITIKEAKKKKEDEEEEEEKEKEIDLSQFKRKRPAPKVVEEAPAKKTAAKKAEKVEPVAKEEPAAEEKPAKKTAKKKAAEVPPVEEVPAAEEAPKTKRKGAEVKVVGKIDLPEEKPKTRGKKKKDEEVTAEEPPAEVATPEVVADTPDTEEPVKEERELIRVNVEKLSGLKLMGKIDLPAEKKKDSSSAAEADKKRKRKRVGKVDIQKQQEIDRRTVRTRPAPTPDKVGMSEAEIQQKIKDTLARLGGSGKSKASKFRKAKREAVAQRTEEEMLRQEEENRVLKLTEFVTVSELATMMNRQPTEIIQACMSLGIFASINQRLDAETIAVIAEEFGHEVEFVSSEVTEAVAEVADNPEDLLPRPPVVTVMGHVDHGKTSLLDFVRSATVVAGEAGGITQHIGAYSVMLPNEKRITFLDTPGHEAFTAMRARGAQVTDLTIIVIAADDSVMPQTREAISHAQAAGVPMIFALNKMDKPEANPDRIREQLSQMNILVEEWGGKFQSQEISAKKGLNVDALLEKVLLEAELLDLKANPKKPAHGTVIESKLDTGRGYIATVLVEAGTLKIGDPILAGQWSGRVKAMFNERGQKVEVAGPSTPVSLLGFEGAPNAGDKFYVMEDEREARNIATKRQQLQREQSVRTKKHLTIEEIGRRIALGDFKELNLIVKGDVDGSVEALTDSLEKLSTENIQVRIIHKGVGQISESDVLLASASDAIVVGFQVRPSLSARKLAESEEIQIRLYSVIYKAIAEIKEAMEGMLSAKIEEKIVGTAEIRDVFKITKVGNIAGCMVTDGKITRQNRIRIIRDGIVIHTGSLETLKRFKDDVKEVAKGYECGLNIEKFNDIAVGDIIEAFEEVEVKQTL